MYKKKLSNKKLNKITENYKKITNDYLDISQEYIDNLIENKLIKHISNSYDTNAKEKEDINNISLKQENIMLSYLLKTTITKKIEYLEKNINENNQKLLNNAYLEKIIFETILREDQPRDDN